MESVTAVVRNGRIELVEPVDWPDGTKVAVTPVDSPNRRTSWLSLPPLDVGEFRELTAEDDLLGKCSMIHGIDTSFLVATELFGCFTIVEP
jgi:hypothetical protein